MTNQLMERISQLKYQIPRIIARQKEKEKRKKEKGKSWGVEIENYQQQQQRLQQQLDQQQHQQQQQQHQKKDDEDNEDDKDNKDNTGEQQQQQGQQWMRHTLNKYYKRWMLCGFFDGYQWWWFILHRLCSSGLWLCLFWRRRWLWLWQWQRIWWWRRWWLSLTNSLFGLHFVRFSSCSYHTIPPTPNQSINQSISKPFLVIDHKDNRQSWSQQNDFRRKSKTSTFSHKHTP